MFDRWLKREKEKEREASTETLDCESILPTYGTFLRDVSNWKEQNQQKRIR